MATVDVAYPSNQETFGAIVAKTPAVIVKAPNSVGNLFSDFDWEQTATTKLNFRDVAEWGKVISYEELCKSNNRPSQQMRVYTLNRSF